MKLQLRHTSFIAQSLKEIHSGRETGLIDTDPFSNLSLPSAWYKAKCKTFIQCFEHAECIAIDIFDMLGIEWLNAPRLGSLDNVKKETHFPQQN